ncbi:MAG: hypothetical protein IPQ09_03155 [Myxococcales bacterium]|jgi:hypothetical protein|nr:hypothetical protein [Myxococcales bacterium]HQY61825.1 hypothetical protein [Polyangiaceae bacterium]
MVCFADVMRISLSTSLALGLALTIAASACAITSSPTATDAGPANDAAPTPVDATTDTTVSPPDGSVADASGPPPTYPLATPDEVCDGVPGLTGAALIAAIKPEYAATFTPRTGSSSALSIKLKYEGGAIVCHRAFKSMGGAPDMPAWIALTAAMDFSTADGLFAEKRAAQVSRRFGDALELSVEVPVADVKGTFTPAAMPGFDVIRVGIGGSLMPAGTTSGNVQQFGSKSAVPPPGQVNPSVTQPVGSWK